jgi:hypothetical protein
MPDDVLERVWEYREEVLYRKLFSDLGHGIYPIPAAVFSEVFAQNPDPRWLHVGVFACPPSTGREFWTYVSSGLSNPWEQVSPVADVDSPSGLGVEFVFSTSAPGEWAIHLMHRVLAFELLLSHGRYPGREPLGIGDRIPLRGPIRPGTDSKLDWLLVCPPARLPGRHSLDSGYFVLFELVGATAREAAFAREKGLEALLERLEARRVRSLTDPARLDVLSEEAG